MPGTLIFDTLAYSKRLIAAGFTQRQAEIQADTLKEIIDEKIASKRDLKELDVNLSRDIKELEVALKTDMKELEVALKTDMKELEVALKSDIEEKHVSLKRDMKEMEITTKSSLKELEMKLTIKLGGMMAAAIAIVAVLVKLL